MDELISRKAAIDAMKNLCEECDADHCGECRIDHPDKDAKSVLEALPSADEPSQVAKDIARIVENEQDMRVIAQSEKRTETHACDSISRQAAIDEIRKCRFVVDAIEKIRGLPPAETQIIRCKDCKYYNGYRCSNWRFFYCICNEDDFCSFAERKDNG